MSANEPLSMEDLQAEAGRALPDKEVVSLLDLFVDVNLALDLAAPIDLAVAANANAALPIDGAVTANILSAGSDAISNTLQGGSILQSMDNVTADAYAPQDASIDQSNDVVDAGTTDAGTTDAGTTDTSGGLAPDGGDATVVGDTTGTVGDTTGTVGDTTGTVGDTTGTVGDTTGSVVNTVTDSGLLDGGLLNVNVNVDLDADLAAPISGAVAANANVAAPVSASVAANIGSIDSTATAIAQQGVDITQTMTDTTATASTDQTAAITQ